MENLYPRVVGYVRETPWALDPRWLAVMLDVVAHRSSGGRLTRDQIRERVGAKRTGRPAVRLVHEDTGEVVAAVGHGQPLAAVTSEQAPASVVAVLGVYGPIAHRARQVDDISGPGGTSVERLTRRFREVVNDPAVKGVVLDVDSPGGSVYGVQELADEIRAARGRKPIEAVANALMASAAYYLGSAAEKVWVTPSGEAGSIGVYGAHVDLSKFYEAMGEHWTLVAYGENKTLGNPFEPLSAEARADMEKRVGEYGRAFERDVAKSRGTTAARVRKDFGQGLVFGAKEATDRGVVDGAATLDEVVDRMRRARRGRVNEQEAAPAAAALPVGPAPRLVPAAAMAAFVDAQREAAERRARILLTPDRRRA